MTRQEARRLVRRLPLFLNEDWANLGVSGDGKAEQLAVGTEVRARTNATEKEGQE